MQRVELVHPDIKGSIVVLPRQVPQHEASGWTRKGKPRKRTRKTTQEEPPQDPDQQQEDDR